MRALSKFIFALKIGNFSSATIRLGRMVAREQALEGGFRHTHARLIAHAEEVALLKGAAREVKAEVQVVEPHMQVDCVCVYSVPRCVLVCWGGGGAGC